MQLDTIEVDSVWQRILHIKGEEDRLVDKASPRVAFQDCLIEVAHIEVFDAVGQFSLL